MVSGSENGLMEMHTKDIGIMVNNVDKEKWTLKTEVSMREDSEVINLMEMESINRLMEIVMKEIGWEEINKVKESLFPMMVVSIKDSLILVSIMEKEFYDMLTEINMKEVLKTINHMDKELKL